MLDTSQLCYEGDFDTQVSNLLKKVRLARQEVEDLKYLFKDLEDAFQSTWLGINLFFLKYT